MTSDLLLSRGADLTSRLRSVMVDLSTWTDELPTNAETVDAHLHADQALVALEHALASAEAFVRAVVGEP